MYSAYTMRDVHEASSKKLFTVISTFAGGGGSSTGYRLSGGDVLAMNEFVQEAVNTYKANYPSTVVVPGDIKLLSGEDFLKASGLSSGQLDIFDGSPPCSAFSVAGVADKGWNKTKSYSDNKTVTNIEDLFLEFIRIAEQLKPKVIVAENVKGLDIGKSKSKRNQFLNAFDHIGYMTTFIIMNGANYGVPQARQRLFFVGIRNDVAESLDIDEMLLSSLVTPKTSNDVVSLYDAIHDIENDKEEVEMLLNNVNVTFLNKWIDRLPINPKKHVSPSDVEFRDVNPNASLFNMIRPAPHLPSPTLTQTGQQLSASGVFHYEERRKFTIKELKRIMSLPDDYILTGRYNQQAERCCRMVAPFMLKALSEQIYNMILLPYKEIESV